METSRELFEWIPGWMDITDDNDYNCVDNNMRVTTINCNVCNRVIQVMSMNKAKKTHGTFAVCPSCYKHYKQEVTK